MTGKMRKAFGNQGHTEERPRRRAAPRILGKILMFIGLLTVLYLLIVYVIIPVLAMMTP